MAKRLAILNQLRPRITSQNIVDQEALSGRISKNTTYHVEEIHSILRMYTSEIIEALRAGETVKIDGLLLLTPNMKIGGEVDLGLRPDRGAIAALNNPTLWTADKVSNHANLSKDTDTLVAQWNKDHPDDVVSD
ncbi:MAG: hypothetical protein WA821_23725 [Anaerolineales bacterium]